MSSNKTMRGWESGRTTWVIKVIGGISQDSPFFEINPAGIILKLRSAFANIFSLVTTFLKVILDYQVRGEWLI